VCKAASPHASNLSYTRHKNKEQIAYKKEIDYSNIGPTKTMFLDFRAYTAVLSNAETQLAAADNVVCKDMSKPTNH